jgi:hypothetical protein
MLTLVLVWAIAQSARAVSYPAFVAAPEEWFPGGAAVTSAWADFDDDGDLDVVVSFVGTGLGLYRNEGAHFTRVDAGVHLAAEEVEARSLAWGDYDGDGDVDLYAATARAGGSVFLPGQAKAQSLLFRNDGAGRFDEVSHEAGVDYPGPNSRQSNWIDFDNDGDLDLFVSQRSSENTLYRNDGGKFTDASQEARLDDPRRSVGSCWFDMDRDGDLDLFLANQQGDQDAFYRNDDGVFTDVGRERGLHQPHRTLEEGGVSCASGDYDNDGDFDLFVATYGSSLLYTNDGHGNFAQAAQSAGLSARRLSVGSSSGDYDNDGWLDLYVAAYVADANEEGSRGVLYRNDAGSFLDVLPTNSPLRSADHGIQWIDFDRDGDLDLSLTESYYGSSPRHRLFVNRLPLKQRRQSLQVSVLDENGHATRAGAEVRLYDRKGGLLGTRLVATGDGYGSQSAAPVHFGLRFPGPVTIEVTFLSREGRRLQRLPNVNPGDWIGRPVKVRQTPKT